MMLLNNLFNFEKNLKKFKDIYEVLDVAFTISWFPVYLM